MPFNIPNTDDIDWSEPLRNHLAQLNDPDTGGFNIFNDINQRDSVLWPNGTTTKDQYANKTIYLKKEGTFQYWNISNDSLNRTWIDLSKNSSTGELIVGKGTVSSDGLNTITFSAGIPIDLEMGDVIVVNQQVYTVSQVNPSSVKIFGSINDKTFSNMGWFVNRDPSKNTLQNSSITLNGTNVTFSVNPSTFGGVQIGDFLYIHSGIENYGTQFSSKIIAVNGSTVTLNTSTTGYNSTGGWALFKKLSGAPYSIGYRNRSWSYQEKVFSITQQCDILCKNSSIYLTGKDQNDEDVSTSIYPSSLVLNGRGKEIGPYSSLNMYVLPDNLAEWPASASGDIFIDTRFEESSSPNWFVINSNTQNKIAFQLETSKNNEYKTINKSILVLERDRAGVLINSPSERLHVNGNILANGTITAGSDERWKKNIKVLENPLELLNKLKGVNYEWIDSELRDENIHIGCLAQDAIDIPGAVKVDNEGFLHLDYMGLVGLLIEVNKALLKRIENLENK